MDNRKTLVLIVACILIVGGPLVYYFYVWIPQQVGAQFENYYLNIMKNLSAEENITIVRSWFERDYNYTELCQWVNSRIKYVPLNESCKRSTNPIEILENGEGRCGEFSYLYVATCLAHGYDSRLVVAVDVSNPNNWSDLHVWAEIEDDGWVHVEPTGNAWNDPYRYERGETGDWGKDIGSTVKIYAFENGICEEVTLSYLS